MATPSGATAEIRGAAVWAKQAIPFGKLARLARPRARQWGHRHRDGAAGDMFRVVRLTSRTERLRRAQVIGDTARLGALDLSIVD